ncbi:MAG: zinc-dependent alcohol dehydrogenase family protein [Chitinivibrionia bacterium]|nr:zinc-dependent alcohol dehydrogenase family protein [Chitinivibrionia bacterium]
MKAMLLKRICSLEENDTPLSLESVDEPVPGRGEILVQVTVCGVCRTELDEIEGRTPPPRLPVIPGHQVIGIVAQAGEGVARFATGDRVGIAWIYSSCGRCSFCAGGKENLCAEFRATGRDADGGYAEYVTVGEGYAFAIPPILSDAEAAPLLCAGAVGYRALRLAQLEDGHILGLTGFGASGHLVLKMAQACYPRSPVFVFARSEGERSHARDLGAAWTGSTEESPPEKLHSIIDTTPAWKPVVKALRNLRPGGRLVINGIRKEDKDKNVLLSLDYTEDLWMEKEIKSVANVERRDVMEFLELAARIPIKPDVREYSLDRANTALMELKRRAIRGAKVLRIA